MTHLLKSSSATMVRPQILRRSKVPTESTAFCGYTHRTCMQPRIEGYDFCTRHILEDKNNPFKQCQYISHKTNKRCSSAAMKADKRESYCTEHARQMSYNRYRANRKRKPPTKPQSLLDELELYGPSRGNHGNSSEIKKSKLSEASKILEYASSSDSETEALLVEHTWRGDGDSDAESIDSEQEDPLKHAGVYTAEEVALITRDKLIRLQSLYIDQFKRLQHVMKEKRRRYLHTVGSEREALGSIHYAKEDPEQKEKYDELIAMKRYHKRFGQEALLHRQSKERRISVSEGTSYKPPSYPKCIFSRSAGRCGARSVPLTKYCFNHILFDPHQVLFRPCNFGGVCKRPVPAMFEKSSCLYHSQPKHIDYRLPRKDEKDECRDEIDVVGGADTKQEQPPQSLQLQIQLQQEQLQLDPGCSKDGTPPSSQPSSISSTSTETSLASHSTSSPLVRGPSSLATTGSPLVRGPSSLATTGSTMVRGPSSLATTGSTMVRGPPNPSLSTATVKAITATTRILIPHKSRDVPKQQTVTVRRDAKLCMPVASRDAKLYMPVTNRDTKLCMPVASRDAKLCLPVASRDAKLCMPVASRDAKLCMPVASRQKTTVFKLERRPEGHTVQRTPTLTLPSSRTNREPIILPAPVPSPQVSPSPSQVPLVVSDLLAEEEHRQEQVDPTTHLLTTTTLFKPNPSEAPPSQIIPRIVEMSRASTEDRADEKVAEDGRSESRQEEAMEQDDKDHSTETASSEDNLGESMMDQDGAAGLTRAVGLTRAADFTRAAGLTQAMGLAQAAGLVQAAGLTQAAGLARAVDLTRAAGLTQAADLTQKDAQTEKDAQTLETTEQQMQE